LKTVLNNSGSFPGVNYVNMLVQNFFFRADTYLGNSFGKIEGIQKN